MLKCDPFGVMFMFAPSSGGAAPGYHIRPFQGDSVQMNMRAKL